jgi:hypothetical protein
LGFESLLTGSRFAACEIEPIFNNCLGGATLAKKSNQVASWMNGQMANISIADSVSATLLTT